MHRSRLAPILVLAVAGLAACGRSAPGPSHISGPYRGKLPDDTLMEASTTVLITTRDAILAVDCRPLARAVASNDQTAIARAVAAGMAAALPANVTIYTPPFSPANPRSAPFVVTDDKFGGTLCTPDAVRVVKS